MREERGLEGDDTSLLGLYSLPSSTVDHICRDSGNCTEGRRSTKSNRKVVKRLLLLGLLGNS